MEKKRKSFFDCVESIARPAELLLLVGLPVVLIELLTVLCGFLRDYEMSKIYAVTVYTDVFTYIMMSLTLLIGGALLIDYVIKSYE